VFANSLIHEYLDRSVRRELDLMYWNVNLGCALSIM
jgi:hypothetical protein